MEKIIIVLCNLYYYIFRRRYRYKLRLTQRVLRHVRLHLQNEWLSWASTQDRGDFLEEQRFVLGRLWNKEQHCQYKIEKYFS